MKKGENRGLPPPAGGGGLTILTWIMKGSGRNVT